MQCYACELESTSLEHIPPKCIFPHGNEIEGQESRVNLVTVNSCLIHNSEKSGDDQLFFTALALTKLTSSNVSHSTVRARFKRGVFRRPALLKSILIKGHVTTNGDYVGKINGPRLDSYLTLMGRGLEYSRTGRKIDPNSITIVSTFLKPSNSDIFDTDNKLLAIAKGHKFNEFGPNCNKETFYSEFYEDEDVLILKATFYRHLEIYWIIT